MTKNETIPEIPNLKTLSKRSRWKLGLTGWVLIGGLVLLIVGTFVGTVDWNRRTVNLFLFRLDPRYWSPSLVPILWGIVCWLVTDIACRVDLIRRKQLWIRLVIMLSVFCAVLVSLGWTVKKIISIVYFDIYVTYIVGPVAHYISTGTFSWAMLIAPTMAVITITILLYIAVKQRRKKL
jgi:hypothetical protein